MKNQGTFWEIHEKQLEVLTESFYQDRISLKRQHNEKFPSGQKMREMEELKPNADKDIFDRIEVKCFCGNPAFLYCSSIGCKSHAAICREKNSECSRLHLRCKNTLIVDNLHSFLQEKTVKDKTQIHLAMKEFQKYVDNIISQVSEMKASFEEKIKTFGMNNQERTIIEKIMKEGKKDTHFFDISDTQQNINQDFNGQTFSSYDRQSNDDDADWVYDSIQQFKKVVQDTNVKTSHYFQDINNLFQDLHMKYARKFDFQQYFRDFPIFRDNLPSNSNFNTEVNTLISVLNKHMKFNSIRRIFFYQKSANRSTSEFNHSRFYQSLQGKSNLLFLVRNNFNKFYGFFTSSKFQAGNSQWISNEDDNSIVFSLNMKIEQKLTNSQFCLKYNKKQGYIEIGEFDFGTNQVNGILKNKNGARIFFGEEKSKQFPVAQIFLKKTQPLPTTINNVNTCKHMITLDEIDYKKIHGEERKEGNLPKGPQISILQVYEIRVAESKIQRPIKIQDTLRSQNSVSSKPSNTMNQMIAGNTVFGIKIPPGMCPMFGNQPNPLFGNAPPPK